MIFNHMARFTFFVKFGKKKLEWLLALVKEYLFEFWEVSKPLTGLW